MSRRVNVQQIQEDVSPNLIPMIDIMFLLLLFFMLGADMGQRELEEVMLPQARSIKDDKEEKGKKLERLTINVFHPSQNCPTYAEGRLCRIEEHWKFGARGKNYTPEVLEQLLAEEASRFREEGKEGGASDRRVMIRADAASPFGHVQDVMRLCGKVGIYQIECGAARPPERS